MNVYKLTLIAILSTLAIVGRLFLTFIPNAQPVTAIIIMTGLLLGPLSGVLIALITTFVSNIVLGMGIWTIWQILSWSIIGLLAGLLGKLKLKQLPIVVVFSFLAGYLYGFLISLTTYQVSGKFWPYYIAGLPFDTSHAIGNVVFIILLYPLMTYLLKKYAHNRFSY
ncbi:MAG TPA: ECF transporter S component [Pseudogracilibacillus sp.]|nr:ECF transporter S component [Pseudogracilibacillus sp.]